MKLSKILRIPGKESLLALLQSVSDIVRLVWRRTRRAVGVVLTYALCIFIAWVAYFFYFYSWIDQMPEVNQGFANLLYVIFAFSAATAIASPFSVFQVNYFMRWWKRR